MGGISKGSVSLLTRRRLVQCSAAALSITAAGIYAQTPKVFRPEDFGARGDGKTNDSAAFAALSEAVRRHGGGTVILRNTVYVVGRQRRRSGVDADYFLAPDPILAFEDCATDVLVEGNGATLLAAPGLFYGAFDAKSGSPVRNKLPFYQRDTRAAPYLAMVHVSGCRDKVHIRNLTLDGNLERLNIGGQWGDKGWQVAGSGLVLHENRGDEVVENVTSRNHPLDGVMIDGVPFSAGARRTLTNVVSDGNGRQGCSIVGGGGYVFNNCHFARTGAGKIASAPGAGVDIEPEGGKTVSRLRFEGCRFSDNAGPGMLVGGLGSSDVFFVDSAFIGTKGYSAWPAAPRYAFERCSFVGTVTNCFGDPQPANATRFTDCSFRDLLDSGSASIYLGGGASGPIVDISTSRNVQFTRCLFDLRKNGRLPWSTAAIYTDCTMRQRTAEQAYPRGSWLGRSDVRGNVDVGGSKIRGTLLVNGKPVGRTD